MEHYSNYAKSSLLLSCDNRNTTKIQFVCPNLNVSVNMQYEISGPLKYRKWTSRKNSVCPQAGLVDLMTGAIPTVASQY